VPTMNVAMKTSVRVRTAATAETMMFTTSIATKA
jgi:hypothetical protein